MKELTPGSIGEQIDELVAHLIERNDRLSSDVSDAIMRIEVLQRRMALAGVAIVLAAVFGSMAWLAEKWIGIA